MRTDLLFVHNALSVTIETIASEIARELLREPAFKAELKQMAQMSFRRAVRDLHKKGGRK